MRILIPVHRSKETDMPLAMTLFGVTFSGTEAAVIVVIVIVVVVVAWWLTTRRRV